MCYVKCYFMSFDKISYTIFLLDRIDKAADVYH